MKKQSREDVEEQLRRKGLIIKKLNDIRYAMMTVIVYDDDYGERLMTLIHDLRDDYYLQANEYFMDMDIDDPVLKSLEKM